VNAAIAERGGTLTIVRAAKDGQSEVAAAGVAGVGSVGVPALPLESVVAQAGARPEQVAFVWSDTQGFETQVLASGRALWAAGTPAYVELWPEALERHGGIAACAAVARASFRGFILKRDLVARGADAIPRPAEELEAAVRSLRKQTDGLLVP
jgi:hypothetical protein